MKNLMDFSIGTLVFWMVGYGIMFGADAFFLTGATAQVSEGLSTFTTWIFHVVFAATAAFDIAIPIPTGPPPRNPTAPATPKTITLPNIAPINPIFI